MIMKAMQITPQQFQQMLQMTGNNQLMNQTIGDLFKNGTVQQATSVQQLTPEQFQQLAGSIQQHPSMQTFQVVNQPQKPSFFQKLQNFFK